MSKYLSMTAIMIACFCFAGSFANERTESNNKTVSANVIYSADQDTSMNRRQAPPPVNNMKRDMGDTTRMMPARPDTTLMSPMPADTHTMPAPAPKRRM